MTMIKSLYCVKLIFIIYKAHLKTAQGWPKCCTDQEAQIKNGIYKN